MLGSWTSMDKDNAPLASIIVTLLDVSTDFI